MSTTATGGFLLYSSVILTSTMAKKPPEPQNWLKIKRCDVFVERGHLDEVVVEVRACRHPSRTGLIQAMSLKVRSSTRATSLGSLQPHCG